MNTASKVVIDLLDAEDEGFHRSDEAYASQTPSTLPGATANCQSREHPLQEPGLKPEPALTHFTGSGKGYNRSTSVCGLQSGQGRVEAEPRSLSETSDAAPYRDGSGNAVKAVSSPHPALQSPAASTLATASRAPLPYIAPRPEAKREKYTGPSSQSMNRVDHASQPFGRQMGCQQLMGPLVSFAEPPQAAMQHTVSHNSPVESDTPKRKASGAPVQPVKRTKTTASNRPSYYDSNTSPDGILWSCPPPVFSEPFPASSSTVVDSILWSTPQYDPSKDGKSEGSPPKAKQARKPRNKPWTCKMLADLSALIQKSVPWGEFAEQNGKTLADVMETYSVVVSMPLLDFADRGQKRIAQKTFRDMQKKYREMEKDAVKTANQQAKQEAEEYFGVKKKAKGKKADRKSTKADAAGKDTISKRSQTDEENKMPAKEDSSNAEIAAKA